MLQKITIIKNLFVYGSLLLARSPVKLTPIESVFIPGYKFIVTNNSDSTYFYLQLVETGHADDVATGYLVEISDEDLERVDKYEGSKYERKKIDVFKRDKSYLAAFAYVAKN